MDADHADMMRDTVAFIRARFYNDREAAEVLLNANEAGVIMGLVDMNIACVHLISDILGVPPEKFLDTMTTVGGWITGVRDV